MGPDCGTAIIAGVPLGFANAVRRGAIGVVGASGTGMQEVTCRIHQLGEGVSHAIGTGSRDVYDEIGGTTLLAGLELLARDPATRVIVIVSKPPAASVAERALAAVRKSGKPTVVLFLGADASRRRQRPSGRDARAGGGDRGRAGARHAGRAGGRARCLRASLPRSRGSRRRRSSCAGSIPAAPTAPKRSSCGEPPASRRGPTRRSTSALRFRTTPRAASTPRSTSAPTSSPSGGRIR